jgi:3alpha(or 20beta)-hydroxysteroid dehydrogenase
MENMKRLEGKVAIISGAAQGMGAATARIFAAQGAKIVIGDVQADKLHEVAVSIGPAAIAVKLDVREEADWQNAVATAVEKFGKLTTLVNNAAVVLFGATEELDKQAAQRLLDINVIGTLMGVKHAVPALRANGGGVIVNISSIDGLTGFNGRIAYTASKWAVRGITKALAYEYGPEGIRVISVHPGGVNTIMGNPYGQPAEELREGYRRVPLQRIGEPEDIARVTAFAASDEAAYVTGAEIAVDGGWTAGHYEAMLPGGAAYVKG